LSFSAIAASAPRSNPHVFHIHSGFPRGASLLIARDGMYAGFAGAKACQKKSLFLEALYDYGFFSNFPPKQSWLELSNV